MCFNYTDSSPSLAIFVNLVDLHRDPYYCIYKGILTGGPWEVANRLYLACFLELSVSIRVQLDRNSISDELHISPHPQLQKASKISQLSTVAPAALQ